jgi:hypothetical protein
VTHRCTSRELQQFRHLVFGPGLAWVNGLYHTRARKPAP